jgi:amino acid adenylation domain-containing protein
LAEATLFVSGNPVVRPPVIKSFAAESLARHRVEEQPADVDAQELVSCGATFRNQKTLIVNPETEMPCAPGEVGEIWIAGESVAKGYWKRPEETQNIFRARLTGVPCETFLRTGDLGFLHDGELFVTGRLKDLIIIRGRNLYPQDIEQTVWECHADLRRGSGVAFSIDVEGEERLVIVQELERHTSSDLDALIQRVRQAITEEHEVQPVAIALVKTGSVPKTSSGKLQRSVSRELFLSGSFETLAEWREDTTQTGEALLAVPAFEPEAEEEIKEFLKSLFATRLGTVAAEVDVDEPLARYALDSLQAIELMHAVEVSLGIVLPMTSFLQSPSITELAAQAMQYLTAKRLSEHEASATTAVNSILPNTLTTHQPSYGQQALWLVSRLAPESAVYNVASAVRIRSEVDPAAMRRALQKLIERHPSLRTTFNEIEGTPVAVVCEEVEVSFDFADASSWAEADLNKHLTKLTLQPFNLETGPLFRVNLFQRSEQEYVLLWVAHHIVVDFWSLVILVHELGELYEAEQHGRAASLASISETYSGYVSWQTEMLEGPQGLRLRSYWEKQLGGTLPALNLPADRPRPAVPTYRGSSCDFALDVALTRQLKALGKNHDATLYMTLLAAFQVLLYRYTGQDDILVGSPAAARSRAAFSNVVGYFVNPLVLRADLSGNPAFTVFLGSVRRTVLEAFAHQDYPFALLVKQLQPERDLSRSPLFQASFVLQQAQLLKEQGLTAFALGQGGAPLRLGQLSLETMALEQRVAQFDLSLVMAEIGGELRACLEYNTDIFEAATIAQMVRRFRVLLEGVVADPSQSVSSLPLLSEEDRRQVLVEWNDTVHEFPQAPCLHQIFEQQVEQSRDTTAVTFEGRSLGYADLNRRSNQLAHHLIKLGVGPEVSVAICMERSLELPIALLAVLKAGGAYVPLDPSYPHERLTFIIEEINASVVLTQQAIAEDHSFGVHTISLDGSLEELASESTENPRTEVTDDNLCYVIYTSGSTGQPKGAMLHHRGVRNRLLWGITDYQLGAGDVVLHKTPLTFDVSVWEIFAPLLSGARLLIAKPGGHQDTAYQLDVMAREKVTHVDYVPTMLEVLLEADGLDQCDHLKVVTAAGEALTRELRDRFYLQTNAKLYNLYGPTEASLAVTYWVCEPDEQERVIPIGRPMSNVRIYILDQQLQPVPLGVAGELHIGGVAPGRGYLKRPDLTADKFIPDAFSQTGGERLYKTGDLARYRSDGAIEFLGRLDHQVKIRGMRMELGEVEAALTQHPAVREAVILAHEITAGNKSLVAYVVSKQEPLPTSDELRNYLRQRLPEYMVPATLFVLSELPLTPNGKIDRSALTQLESLSTQFEETYTAPTDQVQEMLVEIWAAVLGVERVGIHDNFFELGGHSLLAAQAMSRVQKAFKTELPLRLLFEFPSVAAFAEQMNAIRKDDLTIPPPFELVSREEDLPLSFAQQRLWFIDQLDPGHPAYNMPGAVRLSGLLDHAVLEKSLSEIVRRHEALRTSFPLKDGGPIQFIAPPAPLDVPVTDLRELTDRDAQLNEILTREAHERFDLARGPLLRVKLVRLADDEHVLLVTMHHIVSDGWSLHLFLRELATLYQAYSEGTESPLPELPIQYADFANWQRNWLRDEKLDSLLGYWVNQLKNAPPVLELPSDRSRTSLRGFEGTRQSLTLPQNLTDELKRLSREEGVTLFMVLAAAFKVLLYRYSGQTDIVIATASANRNQAEIEELIGFFVNTLVLRTDLSATRTFRALLEKIRETVIDACTHQELPFEKIVEELHPERSVIRTPLFQVMLVQQKQLAPEIESAGVRFQSIELETTTTKFDLTLSFVEADQELLLTLEYSTELFEAPTVKRMLGHLHTLLASAANNPGAQISELPLLSAEEREEILVEFNGAAVRESVPALSLHQLFEAQVVKTPSAIALVFGAEKLSYAQLNQRANRLARYLRELGVRPEVLAGICLERGINLIVAVLAVLKAGGAYVPLDPDYPQDRLAFMLADARPAVLLTTQSIEQMLPPNDARAVRLDIDAHLFDEFAGENVANELSADNPAYVIYTSGSTGQPKGVVVTHRGLGNIHEEQVREFGNGPRDRVLQFASLNFDASVYEMLMSLATGATLVLATKDELLPGPPLQTLLREQSITNLTIPPSVLALIPSDDLPALRTVIVGGEACSAELVDRWSNGREFFDGYGPTETTIWSSISRCRAEEGTPTIGKPIGNTQMFVLDENLEPVPPGVAGELYIGGIGLARGYLNRPELTATRFVPHLFATTPGARLYRTGDLCRYRADGNIEFLGRMDHQVKIRGFRVELGEIETALGEHPMVQEVVVLVREDTPDDKRIVAYVVLSQECAADELRQVAKDKLPSYMIPSAFVVLDALPLSPNGKVDRQALPAPDNARPDLEGAFVAPRTPIEEIVAGIWSQILKLEHVGIHDNFFSLGGHSLLATQVAQRVRQTFNIELPLRLFFETPTVAELASYVVQSQMGEADDATLTAALAELSQLSAEELGSLLAAEKIST